MRSAHAYKDPLYRLLARERLLVGRRARIEAELKTLRAKMHAEILKRK